MFRVICLFALFAVGYGGILDFKLTIDKRLLNEQGKINPVPFGREAYKTLKPYMNATEQVQQNIMMTWVRQTYGNDKAVLIEKLLNAIQDVSKQLPESLKASFNEGLEKLNTETLQIDYTFEKARQQIPPGAILQRIQQEIIPLAAQIFYNPFDQEANAKLSPNDVTVIQHTFF